MTTKTFKNKYSSLVVEVYDSGWIVLHEGGITLSLGKPPNKKIQLILDAIKYVEERGNGNEK